jgi:hypothetical protein
LQLGQQLVGHGGALQAFDDIALHGDGVVAPSRHITPGSQTNTGLAICVSGMDAAGRGQVGVGHIGDGVALLSGWRSTMSISLSPSRYWPTVVPLNRSRGLGDGLAGHAQRARLVLVDLQAQHLDGLVPVVVHAAHVGVGAHDALTSSA